VRAGPLDRRARFGGHTSRIPLDARR